MEENGFCKHENIQALIISQMNHSPLSPCVSLEEPGFEVNGWPIMVPGTPMGIGTGTLVGVKLGSEGGVAPGARVGVA